MAVSQLERKRKQKIQSSEWDDGGEQEVGGGNGTAEEPKLDDMVHKKQKSEEGNLKAKKKKKKKRGDEHGLEKGENGTAEEPQHNHMVHKKQKSQEGNLKAKKKKKGKRGDENSLEKGGNGRAEEPKHDDMVQKKQNLHKGWKSGAVETAVIQSSVMEREVLTVTVSGLGSKDPKFKPHTTFDIPGVPQNVLACCGKFDKPSPIQAHAWPFLLAGRDLIGIARTGSGKTLAFGVPGMVHVLKSPKSSKPCPVALVLAPTRELTQQIAEVLEEAGGSCGVKIACIYGGTSKGPQIAALKAGATIIVATPGRLQDLMEQGVCSLDLVSYVVLDEADRMLDLGFEPSIRAIINLTAKTRQMLMFSATWPVSVDKLSKEFMQDSNKIVKVIVGSEDLSANHDVTQIVEVLDEKERIRHLETLLQKYHKSRKNRVIVFVLYKKEAVHVGSMLQQRGWQVAAVHGDIGQSERTRSVQSFRDGTCPLLVATDVAARGLDIPDVEYVINYSFPLTIEDYVHRIGRTGRAGKKGIAHTFFTQVDRARAGELVNVLKEAGQHVPVDLLKFGTHVKKKESALYGAHFKEINASSKQSTKITFDQASDED